MLVKAGPVGDTIALPVTTSVPRLADKALPEGKAVLPISIVSVPTVSYTHLTLPTIYSV